MSSKPPPLPRPIPASLQTTSPPSTTSDNVSCISSPNNSPRFAQHQQPAAGHHGGSSEMGGTPGQSLIFPSAHSKYAAMRVGRSAWTAAYLPPQTTSPYSQQFGALERGSADLEYGTYQPLPSSSSSCGLSNGRCCSHKRPPCLLILCSMIGN